MGSTDTHHRERTATKTTTASQPTASQPTAHQPTASRPHRQPKRHRERTASQNGPRAHRREGQLETRTPTNTETTTTMVTTTTMDGKQDGKPFEEPGPYDDEGEVAALLSELEVRSDDERNEPGPYDDDEVAALLAELNGVPLARSFMARGPGGYLAEVLVDAADYDRVMRGPDWRLQRTNYGKPGPDRYYVARGHGATEQLHRVVMADEIAAWTGPGRAVVDHINGDRFDNRRCNLRVVKCRQNRANSRKVSPTTSSRFKGVTLMKGGRWRAQINMQGRQVHLGTFDDEEDAARAYDDAARAEFGEFACLNYPREGEQCALPPPAANEP